MPGAGQRWSHEQLQDVLVDTSVWVLYLRPGGSAAVKGAVRPDLLIDQAAISRNLVLWHADEDFERIRQVAPLAVRSFLQP